MHTFGGRRFARCRRGFCADSVGGLCTVGRMKGSLTIHDVARAAGFSPAAVSMALRGDRTISAKTRQHIATVARQLGYRINPLVAALMSLQRRRRKTSAATTAIAFLSSHPAGNPWRQQETYRGMFAGASARATELGWRLEEFDLGAKGMTPARLRAILHARHIHAVVIAPLPYRATRITFDFSSLAVVGLGMSVQAPLIERITNDHFQSAALAVERCVALGYRRLGFVLSHETSSRLENRWLGGFLYACEQHGLAERLPPLMTDWTDELAAAMPGWLRAHRPDVVILGNSEASLVARVPASVGVVDLAVTRSDGEQTGIFQDFPLQGAIAVEHAIGKLQANAVGPLAEAQLHLIAGRWVPGATAPGPRRRRPTKGAARR